MWMNSVYKCSRILVLVMVIVQKCVPRMDSKLPIQQWGRDKGLKEALIWFSSAVQWLPAWSWRVQICRKLFVWAQPSDTNAVSIYCGCGVMSVVVVVCLPTPLCFLWIHGGRERERGWLPLLTYVSYWVVQLAPPPPTVHTLCQLNSLHWPSLVSMLSSESELELLYSHVWVCACYVRMQQETGGGWPYLWWGCCDCGH